MAALGAATNPVIPIEGLTQNTWRGEQDVVLLEARTLLELRMAPCLLHSNGLCLQCSEVATSIHLMSSAFSRI